jgi:hypothetical protein
VSVELGVAGLEAASGVRFQQIAVARAETRRRLRERQDRLRSEGIVIDDDAAIVLTGSWGRYEITSGSDDDFMVLFSGSARESALPSVEDAAIALGARAPGREDIFGTHVWLDDLQGKIGRAEDSNANLTRRMLLILESVAVCGETVHAEARATLIAGYLDANVKDHRPPRFLLNDLIRYWRTIAVDFESKMRARRGEGWGLRNAKLRLSRKALFAGGLLPVLECYRYSNDGMLDYLCERMSVPPLDRIADAFVTHGAVDAGIRVMNAYDAFLGILDDRDKRRELTELGVENSSESPLFARIVELGEEFQAGLLALLFDDPELRRWVREYLIF